METIKIGLIPSPDLPTEIISKMIEVLPSGLANKVDQSINWSLEYVVDPLVGSAEFIHDMEGKVTKMKHKNNWDYVICITDLPQFMNGYVVLANVNRVNNIAFVSVPALGVFPMKERVCAIIYEIVKEFRENKARQRSKRNFHLNKSKILSKTKFVHIERVEYNDKKSTDDSDAEKEKSDENTVDDSSDRWNVYYVIASKSIGKVRLLSGMTIANRPWTALFSFKKVIMLAFGTGIYITIFPSSWELSILYTFPRFIVLTIIALAGMVTWIIFAHNLWEKPTLKGDKRLRNLYNYTTISTLSIIVVINYLVLFILFLFAISIFVPPTLFEAVTDLAKEPSIKYYFQLTWIITSLGTLAGSIGTTSENENKIRQITYSYRQIRRYYDIQDNNKKESNEEDST